MNKTKIAIISTIALATILNTGCGSSSSTSSSTTADSGSMVASLNDAVTYMENALPDVNSSSSFVASSVKSSNVHTMTAYTDLAAIWSSSTSGEKITIPGGQGGDCTDPTYNGIDLETNSTVNIKDFIGMSLDTNYERCSSGGGASEYYKPTIFGRLSNATMIIGYLNSFMPKDANGVFENGDGNSTISVDGNSIDVYYTVQDAAVTTYYDKAISVRGYLSGTSNQVFSNLMWMRNDDTNLNFSFMETGDWLGADGNNSDSGDGIEDSVTYTLMKYNKSTGEMAFEYTQHSFEDTSAATDPLYPNDEIFRLYVAGTGQEAQIMAFQGDSDATSGSGNYTAFSVYGPQGETSTEASVSFNYNYTSPSNSINGKTCVTLADTSASGSSLCSGHTSAADISSSFSTAVSTVLGYTNTTSYLVSKGFQSGTVASFDWSDSTVKAAYLTDGAAISVGFSSVATLATEVDGTP